MSLRRRARSRWTARSGRMYLSPGVEIEEAEGVAPMGADMELWAEGLAVVRSKREEVRAVPSPSRTA